MIAKLSLTAAALGIAFPVAAGPAHAQYRWHGGYGGAVGAGIAGFAAGALLGDAIAGSRYYGYGPGYYGYAPGYYEDGYAPGDDDYAQGTVNSASGPTIRARHVSVLPRAALCEWAVAWGTVSFACGARLFNLHQQSS
jgi:hypothetical protein